MQTTFPITLGSRNDYLSLARHHYRPGHPATFCRVLVINDASPSPTDRFLQRRPDPRPVAVLVESLPSISCAARDLGMRRRYAGMSMRVRGRAVNREVRCISRVIVDPRYRGRGLAVSLVRHALSTAATPITEALAAMGHASPFFERAGMTRIDLPTPPRDARMLAAFEHAGIDPAYLVMPQLIEDAIDALPERLRMLLDRELIRWLRSGAGRGTKGLPSRSCCLAAAKSRLLSRPVYYVAVKT